MEAATCKGALAALGSVVLYQPASDAVSRIRSEILHARGCTKSASKRCLCSPKMHPVSRDRTRRHDADQIRPDHIKGFPIVASTRSGSSSTSHAAKIGSTQEKGGRAAEGVGSACMSGAEVGDH